MNGPTSEELLAQARRIAASSHFAGSDPTRHLLLYLAEHDARHPGESVKEVTLATEALGKNAGYDPRTDSSVRVLASRLRSKLAEYYTQEGVRDRLIIAIPKGAYAITCSYRAAEAAQSGSGTKPHTHSRLRSIWGVALAAAVVATVAVSAGYWAGKRSTRSAAPEANSAFWRHFITGEPPIIVFSNPRFVGDPTTGLRLLTPTTGTPAGTINSQFTGVGEVAAVNDIARQLRLLGKEARVKRAQLFSWDDARTSDLVLVGGHEENLPTAQLLPLEKFNLKAESQEPYPKLGAVRNESPQTGEKPYYFSSADAENGVEYAIVALTHGVTPTRRVLVLAGVHTFGTEGAATFVCTPALVAELYRRLGLKSGDEMVPFESVIELSVRGGSPLPPRLVLVHRRREAAGGS